MTTRKFSPAELDNIRDLARQWGKIVVRQAFGDSGPGLDVDFAQMEQIAQAAAEGLTAGTLRDSADKQALHLGDKQPCPTCNRLCIITHAEREILADTGPVILNEPVSSCPQCRRDFFPSASVVEVGRTQV